MRTCAISFPPPQSRCRTFFSPKKLPQPQATTEMFSVPMALPFPDFLIKANCVCGLLNPAACIHVVLSKYPSVETPQVVAQFALCGSTFDFLFLSFFSGGWGGG